MNPQKGSINVILPLIAVLAVALGSYLFVKLQPNQAQLPKLNGVQNERNIVNKGTPVGTTQPCTKDHSDRTVDRCDLGKIKVTVHRNLSKEKLSQIVAKHDLKISESNWDFTDKELYVNLTDYNNTFTTEEWKEKLPSPVVESIEVPDFISPEDHGRRMKVIFKKTATDQEITDYISEKNLSEFARYDVLFSLSNYYYVDIPEGTEYDWDKLNDESADIINVTQYYPENNYEALD